MRVERIARDKVRIFISYDDLEERGIDRDEIWHNGKKVQDLFWDMMETAYMEVGFDIAGPISVEAFTMPTEGVVVIVTRIPSMPGASHDDGEYAEDEEAYFERDHGFSPRSTPTHMVVAFRDFDDLLAACRTLHPYPVHTALYHYDGAYQFVIRGDLRPEQWEEVFSLVAEYGEMSRVTSWVLEEYGKVIFADHAMEQLLQNFPA
ncbi:adaptor protein MecA [Alicyclobacillus vulcanalis]|uniref:Adapter protein MecA 1/2 n=1 Tax=Alicyclobacillus vulcanalis TaxID=252246 RepID=A0A1N7NBN1_9BACL|nr:adaptor protein MecA [Alicyclobacillus vulcanalis]SIS95795.1 adapter protein MecA 1/2 [Alicyclobacillus vulcanalis]